MQALESLLRQSSQFHTHLCPRQVLGVRIGLAGLMAFGFDAPPTKKQLLVISETDGCFVDGLSAATGCTVGHRTLRVEDYGKIAATFVATNTGYALRIAPLPGIRERAYNFAPGETRRYFAQLRAYQSMPDEEMLAVQEVILTTPVHQLISRPGVRVNCEICGEEIINGREIQADGSIRCRSCSGEGYYRSTIPLLARLAGSYVNE